MCASSCGSAITPIEEFAGADGAILRRPGEGREPLIRTPSRLTSSCGGGSKVKADIVSQAPSSGVALCHVNHGAADSHVANAEHFAFPPDDLAVVRRADPGFEDEFSRTRQDIRGPQQSARFRDIED